ncbi:DNA-binding response OmpR family regulator [Rhizobium sp. BK512]|uniref:hypothetical protein n=1 Tax=Rhizobium sp. BK512 TaxID=2587010 RepID=UPI00160A1748|nr:hypothetical protein [Rhizobium sp. BK512]MBB3564568.1 DNA-binding response OmpR family regulator [Rhizobium sp. BK512]
MGAEIDRLLNGKRVLIVEDDYFIADETRRALESAGAIVIGPASSVESALALIDSTTPDGAILDIRSF